VQNEKGMSRSREFLGFSGTNCEAVIDLDSLQTIKSVTIHSFATGSWIWQPQTEVFISDNGKILYQLDLQMILW
jgi:hexosaminidase